MARHNPEDTLPEARRAPMGSRVETKKVHHTAESLADFEALKAAWRVSDSEVVRRALSEARAVVQRMEKRKALRQERKR